MSIIKYRPLTSLAHRFFDDDFFDHFMNSTSYKIPVDIYEKKNDIHLDFELPGISKDDIDVELDNNTLTIKGSFRNNKDIKEENYYRQERYIGEFSRSFTIPEGVEAEDIKTEFKNGILKLTFPKQKAEKPKKKITIK